MCLQGAWVAGGSQRARREVEWIRSWCSRWRRPTAACRCIFQRSTPACTRSTKTGCRARTPHRPARCCTPSTKTTARATRSHHTCSGDRAEEVWRASSSPQITSSLCAAQVAARTVPRYFSPSQFFHLATRGQWSVVIVEEISNSQRWAFSWRESPEFSLTSTRFLSLVTLFFLHADWRRNVKKMKVTEAETQCANSSERRGQLCGLLLPVCKAISWPVVDIIFCYFETI